MAQNKPQSRQLKAKTTTAQVVLKVLGVQAFLVAVGLGVWLAGQYNAVSSTWSSQTQPTAKVEAGARRQTALPLSLRNFAVPSPGNADPHGLIKKSDFSRAFARLDQALRARSGKNPDQLLHSANAQGGACPINWNDGEPALTLGGDGGGKLDLSAALNRCADAVNRL